jgi:RNA polymerase primary sigma factor
MDAERQKLLRQMLLHGKERGYLTYQEVFDHLPKDIDVSDPDQTKGIVSILNEMGIKVIHGAANDSR